MTNMVTMSARVADDIAPHCYPGQGFMTTVDGVEYRGVVVERDGVKYYLISVPDTVFAKPVPFSVSCRGEA